MMKEYLYDLHVHTKNGSACGQLSGEEVARHYKNLGYSGIVITDHFFGGNIAVPRELPWDEAMDMYAYGYETAKAEGEKIGLNVFFGIEAAYRGTEFLVYGVDKAWLKKNPDIASVTPVEMLTRYKNAGAFISHAHPFRERSYINTIRLYPRLYDAVEVYNSGNASDESFDSRAEFYADSYGLLKTSGSDFHSASQIIFGGMSFKENPKSIYELTELIKSKNASLLRKKTFESKNEDKEREVR